MKRTTQRTLLLMLAVLVASAVRAQVPQDNEHCAGWNNPASFQMLPSAEGNEQYSGRFGEKTYNIASCASSELGVTLNNEVITAANLATYVDQGTGYSSGCGSSLDVNKPFRIMSVTDYPNGKDPLAPGVGLSVVPPASMGNFTRSIRLGNCSYCRHAEALYYDFDVTHYNALFKINYAMVIENPGHPNGQNPTFWVRVLKQVGNNFVPVNNTTMCYTVSSTPVSQGGTVVDGQDGWHATGNVWYRDWSQVAVSLNELVYQRVRIEIIIGDCAQCGHYGYCYIAGSCQPMKLTAGGCASGASDTVTFITAPADLDNYQWYRYCHITDGGISPEGDVNPDNFEPINEPGANTHVLAVRTRHFLPPNHGLNSDTLLQTVDFLCEMTSHMDPAHPFHSYLKTRINNLKPVPSVDTIYACDNSVTLRDYSTAYSSAGGRGVAYNLTEWKFFDQPRYNNNPNYSPVGQYVGPEATHTFTRKGNHCAVMRVFNIDSLHCYADREFAIQSITAPTPRIRFSRDNVCADSLVTIYDDTRDTFGIGANQQILSSTYHKWHLWDGQGFDTTFTTTSDHFDIRLKDTVWVELTAHVNKPYYGDTNNDGRRDILYCDGTARRQLFVEAPPTLRVLGDTIVCNGRTSIVNVQASLDNCSYTWYDGARPTQGGVQIATGNTLTTQPTNDKRYFVEVVSENGCRSWDSIDISILKPSIDYRTKYGRPEICEGDTVKLWSSRATKYDWSGNPTDPSLIGQEHNDTVWATPHTTTEFSVVGYGGSGDHECQADPMKQKITVHPYPQLEIRLTPDYVDSDNPSVQFSDISEYGTASLWDFGDGTTSTIRSIVYTFSDLSQDSILIHLTSYNPLGCWRDTAFYIPVGIFTVWFPNAFTPRLETNKEFRAITNNELYDYELRIYDRAGALIFFSVDPNEGWDGTHNGQECKEGAYVYIANYRRPGVERLLRQRGTVLLIK